MRGNNYARFTNNSKFGEPTRITVARDAIREGDELRNKLQGRRILTDDHSSTQMAHAFEAAANLRYA